MTRLSTHDLYTGLSDRRLRMTVIIAALWHVMGSDSSDATALCSCLEEVQEFLRLAEDEMGERAGEEERARPC